MFRATPMLRLLIPKTYNVVPDRCCHVSGRPRHQEINEPTKQAQAIAPNVKGTDANCSRLIGGTCYRAADRDPEKRKRRRSDDRRRSRFSSLTTAGRAQAASPFWYS